MAGALGIVDAIDGDASGWMDDIEVGLMCGFAKIERRERVERLDCDGKYRATLFNELWSTALIPSRSPREPPLCQLRFSP